MMFCEVILGINECEMHMSTAVRIDQTKLRLFATKAAQT